MSLRLTLIFTVTILFLSGTQVAYSKEKGSHEEQEHLKALKGRWSEDGMGSTPPGIRKAFENLATKAEVNKLLAPFEKMANACKEITAKDDYEQLKKSLPQNSGTESLAYSLATAPTRGLSDDSIKVIPAPRRTDKPAIPKEEWNKAFGLESLVGKKNVAKLEEILGGIQAENDADALKAILKELINFAKSKNVQVDPSALTAIVLSDAFGENPKKVERPIKELLQKEADSDTLKIFTDHWKGVLRGFEKKLKEDSETKDAEDKTLKKGEEFIQLIRGFQKVGPDAQQEALDHIWDWAKREDLTFIIQKILLESPELQLSHDCNKPRLPLIVAMNEKMKSVLKDEVFKGVESSVSEKGIPNDLLTSVKNLKFAHASKGKGSPEYATALNDLIDQVRGVKTSMLRFEDKIKPRLLSGEVKKTAKSGKKADDESEIDSDATKYRKFLISQGLEDFASKLSKDDRETMQRLLRPFYTKSVEIKVPLTEGESAITDVRNLFSFVGGLKDNKSAIASLKKMLKDENVSGDEDTGKIRVREAEAQLAIDGLDKEDPGHVKRRFFESENAPFNNLIHGSDSEAVDAAKRLRDDSVKETGIDDTFKSLIGNGYLDGARKKEVENIYAGRDMKMANIPSLRDLTVDNMRQDARFKNFFKAAREYKGLRSKVNRDKLAATLKKGSEDEALQALARVQGMKPEALLAAVAWPNSKDSEILKLAKEDELGHFLASKKLTLSPDDVKKFAEHVNRIGKKEVKEITDKETDTAALINLAKNVGHLNKDGLTEILAGLKLDEDKRKKIEAAWDGSPTPAPLNPAPPGGTETPETKANAAPPDVEKDKPVDISTITTEIAGLFKDDEEAKQVIGILKNQNDGKEFMQAAAKMFGKFGNYEHKDPKTKDEANARVQKLNTLLANPKFKEVVGGDAKVNQLKEMYAMTGYPEEFFKWAKSGNFPTDKRPYAKMATEFAMGEGIPENQREAVDWMTKATGASRFQVLKARFHSDGPERWKMMGEIVSGIPHSQRAPLIAKLEAEEANPEHKRLLPALKAIGAISDHNFDKIPDRQGRTSADDYFKEGYKESLTKAWDPSKGYHARLENSLEERLKDNAVRTKFIKEVMDEDPYNFAARQARWMEHSKAFPDDKDAKRMGDWAARQALLLAGAPPKEHPEFSYLYFKPHPIIGEQRMGDKLYKPGQILRLKVAAPKVADSDVVFEKNLLDAMTWINEKAAGTNLRGVTGLRSGQFLVEPPLNADFLEIEIGGATSPAKGESSGS